jgi:hypothetical protein
VGNSAGVVQALREQSGMSTPTRATLWTWRFTVPSASNARRDCSGRDEYRQVRRGCCFRLSSPSAAGVTLRGPRS